MNNIIFGADWTQAAPLPPLPRPRQIEIETMGAWLSTGAIWETDRWSENIYFHNEFGMEFYCKCL